MISRIVESLNSLLCLNLYNIKICVVLNLYVDCRTNVIFNPIREFLFALYLLLKLKQELDGTAVHKVVSASIK